MFCSFFIFFAHMKIICQTPSKNSSCKIQITITKNSNLRYFINAFSNNRHSFRYRLPNFFCNLSKVVGTSHPPTSYTTVLFKGCDRNFECGFSIKIRRIHLMEGLSCITHFLVFHPFRSGPKIWLTFIRHLTLMNSYLIQQKNHPSLSNRVQITAVRIYIC